MRHQPTSTAAWMWALCVLLSLAACGEAELEDQQPVDEVEPVCQQPSDDAIFTCPDGGEFSSEIAFAGDVNGDGCDDIVVSSCWGYDSGDSPPAAAYLMLAPFSGAQDVTASEIVIHEATGSDLDVSALAAAGDVDHDGFDDILIGTRMQGDGQPGVVYLLEGPLAGDVLLDDARATIHGESGDDALGEAGAMAGAGDGNGDGRDDVLIGVDNHGGTGAAYLLYGDLSGPIDLSDADAKLVGEMDGDDAGGAVSWAGDIDGDGHDDILIGARNHDGDSHALGAAYVLLSPVNGTIGLGDADAIFLGETTTDRAGGSVAAAGDLDGDGYGDILIGADGVVSNGAHAGAVYVIYGPTAGRHSLSEADLRIDGYENSNLGAVLSHAGNLDGDDHDDLLLDGMASPSGAGVLGFWGPLDSPTYITGYDFAVASIDPDLGGRAATGNIPGDVDGDGLDDILLVQPALMAPEPGMDDHPGGAMLFVSPVDD